MTSSPLVVVVGNPKAASRTRTAGEAAAARIAALTGLDAEGTAVIELADLGPQLFDWSSAAVRAATETLAGATVAVIATPVYKATYTGLLKAFLDWFGQTGLDGVQAYLHDVSIDLWRPTCARCSSRSAPRCRPGVCTCSSPSSTPSMSRSTAGPRTRGRTCAAPSAAAPAAEDRRRAARHAHGRS